MSKNRSLPDQLEIKAGMIEHGERIQYGSETSLMRLAANNLRVLETENVILIEALKKLAFDLEAFIEGGYWPNTHESLDKINFVLKITK